MSNLETRPSIIAKSHQDLKQVAQNQYDIMPEPELEVLSLIERYHKDIDEKKLDLIFGSYKSVEFEISIIPVVQKVGKILANDKTWNKDNVPILGEAKFCSAATKLLLGPNSPALAQCRAYGIQAPSGVGGLRLIAEFLYNVLGLDTFCYPMYGEPYLLIFQSAGFKYAHPLRYWDEITGMFNPKYFFEDLNKVPENSVFITHSCGYNTLGSNPNKSQWKKIIELLQKKNILTVFNSPYQGLNSGDLDEDASTIRLFVAKGMELFCCQSFAVNFGLQGEPVANVTIVIKNPGDIFAIRSQFTKIIRGMYGKPNGHASRIITYILNNYDMYNEWKYNLRIIAKRNFQMKNELRCILELLCTPGDWKFLTNQTGIFIHLGITKQQCEYLISNKHIYVYGSGRINICTVTPENVKHIAKAIDDTVRRGIVY